MNINTGSISRYEIKALNLRFAVEGASFSEDTIEEFFVNCEVTKVNEDLFKFDRNTYLYFVRHNHQHYVYCEDENRIEYVLKLLQELLEAKIVITPKRLSDMIQDRAGAEENRWGGWATS